MSRTTASMPGSHYFGVAEAIVTDTDDPEKEGRVKVRFPWLDNTTVTDWCRVAQVYAGKGHGSFFVPEVEDEVLVAFVHGDASRPIIIGSLYNGEDKPDEYRNSKEQKDPKRILTKGGHELLLDDSDPGKRVRLKTAGGLECDLDDQNKKIVLKAQQCSLVLDGQNQKITLAGSVGSLTIDDQGQKIELKCGAASLKLEGSGTATLEGTTTANIKGAMVNLG